MIARVRYGLLIVAAALAGCSFEGKSDSNPNEMNMCATATDCTDGSDCISGMCQAQQVDAPLSITLQITPLKMPNGIDESLPTVLDAFTVREPIKDKPIDVHSTIGVSGVVRASGVPIDADLSFTPVQRTLGIAPAAVTTTVKATASVSDHDYSVRLLKDVEYRMVARPSDMSLAPFAKTFTATAKVNLDVDFDKLDTTDRTVLVSGVPSDRDLVVTAFDAMSGEPVSSTGMVQDGKTLLQFAADAESKPYRLEIRASNTYEKDMTDAGMAAPDDNPCDTDTPAFPVFSMSSTQVDGAVDSSGRIKVALPPQPTRLRYQGTVELCSGEADQAANVVELPITLHAQTLLFEKDASGKDTDLTASFDTTTSATYDKTTKALHFCVEVMPGEYDVVATPPASMRCALFAERETIEAPDDAPDMAGPFLITLPEAAYLSGTLQTMGSAPLSGASVEAVALGRSDAVTLPANDRSVTRYNRTSQTTTGDNGMFKLPVDLGSYDILIKPPVDSGFPWQVSNDVNVGLGARKAAGLSSGPINMPSPIVVTGALRYPGGSEDAQATLGGAEIDAYAIIDYKHDDVVDKRAVAIGKATADDDGKFMLLLPPNTQSSW